MNLETLRQQIDTVDEQILTLFRQRMRICEQIGIYKNKNGLPVLDEARQTAKLNTLCAQAGEADREAVKRLFETVMAISRARQEGIL